MDYFTALSCFAFFPEKRFIKSQCVHLLLAVFRDIPNIIVKYRIQLFINLQGSILVVRISLIIELIFIISFCDFNQ